ncbi:hypothetical protein ACQEU3_38775 [Spirillospora sp. CA-253888]
MRSEAMSTMLEPRNAGPADFAALTALSALTAESSDSLALHRITCSVTYTISCW